MSHIIETLLEGLSELEGGGFPTGEERVDAEDDAVGLDVVTHAITIGNDGSVANEVIFYRDGSLWPKFMYKIE